MTLVELCAEPAQFLVCEFDESTKTILVVAPPILAKVFLSHDTDNRRRGDFFWWSKQKKKKWKFADPHRQIGRKLKAPSSWEISLGR